MIQEVQNNEFHIAEISILKGEEKWIEIFYEDGYHYLLINIEGLYDLPLTVMFDNFSITPFVILKYFTTFKELSKSKNVEDVIANIYTNNTIRSDFGNKSVLEVIEENQLSNELKIYLKDKYESFFSM